MNLVNWTRKNLFSNWHDTLLTFIILFLFYISIPPLLNWMFFDATFLEQAKKIALVLELVGFLFKFG